MKIVVASKNPVKINAVKKSFETSWAEGVEVVGVSVPSGVSEQPMSDDETLQGAVNRVNRARQAVPGADFYAGIEGGVSFANGRLFAFAWIVVANDAFESHARTSAFELPPAIRDLILEGLELGEADDRVFNQQNSKQQNGAVGLLTSDRMTREMLYREACVLALIPFFNRDLYFSPKTAGESL